MGLTRPETLYQHALEHRYGLGAFNTFNLESMMAVMEAAQNKRSAAIIQVSMGARNYVKHLNTYVDMIKMMAEHYSVPFFIQHDHCPNGEACKEAIKAGVQAVMFDGSHLAFEENVRQTREIVRYAHEKGIWVEAELGQLPGFEDFVFSESAVYTDPEQAKEFVEITECDALAVAMGTSHGGVQGEDYLPFAFDLFQRLVDLMPGYPLVLHGAASLPPELIKACNEQGGKVEYLRNCSEETIAKAVSMGAKKVNMDVDNFLVCTTAVRQFLNEKASVYDPRKYLGPARDAFQKEVEHKMVHVLQSAGRYQEVSG